MTRIVYKKNKEGNAYTTKPFIARSKIISATIFVFEDKFCYVINDLSNGDALHIGTTYDIIKAKVLIKDKMKEMGVLLDDEIRKKID